MDTHAQPALSAQQVKRLNSIAHFHTAYEAVVVRGDGTRVLLAYCVRKSGRGLRDALRKRWDAVCAFLALDDEIATFDVISKNEIRAIGGGVIRWSGRTERDAIMAGELTYVVRAVAAETPAQAPQAAGTAEQHAVAA